MVFHVTVMKYRALEMKVSKLPRFKQKSKLDAVTAELKQLKMHTVSKACCDVHLEESGF